MPTAPPDRSKDPDADASTPPAPRVAAKDSREPHVIPHPPGARTPDEYMDPPGHHRRGRNGPALDVGG